MVLCFTKYIYTFVLQALEPWIKRSHMAIWLWVQRFAWIADRFKHDSIKCILIDETQIKIGNTSLEG
ncbi:MAG: hypothetical protein QW723_02315 [Candidatus Bathyarchaeia archaeon]